MSIPETTPDLQVDAAYLEPGRPVDERVELLLAQMTLEEKAGQLFHTMVMPGPDGSVAEGNPGYGISGAAELIGERQMTHFNMLGAAGSPLQMAAWHNRLQRLAQKTRLGIPITLSSDPRHSFTDNPGTAAMAGAFSQWPEPVGLAAIGDPELVKQFADTVRREYLAVGIRVALHPQIDLATEPRWARQVATFGEDVELTCLLAPAYITGLQGSVLGASSVASMVKHFPGAGPQLGGEDAHFAYGREQAYPGGQFDLHLRPFEAALDAGVAQVMPYYGMPVGTEYDEVGFGFNKSVITTLLRERYGFDGIVCTDWGLITDGHMAGEVFPARAWGVEHLSVFERVKLALDAGVDQFGGEEIPDVIVELVTSGQLDESRLDVSVRRLLRAKFELGLFDDPFVEEGAADGIVGSEPFRRAGEAAQRASITVLSNRVVEGRSTLPSARGIRLYVEGISGEVAARFGEVVDRPEDADLAILRIAAPYEQRPGTFERFFHAGSLEFSDDEIARIRAISDDVPTVLDVLLDRPGVLTPVVDGAAAVLANYGASSAALLDVVFGEAAPEGRLPFDLPRSMAAVEASREDVPFDTADPLFSHGHGLFLGDLTGRG
ncbi:glycoside hydrolase family 3 protein [Herbiconiux liukaitaii]|uniref:glycoside hydrolase family 3 protein n=1 Tax=Herbiconiux liukaitaii TaxID=3342799 RepID=UPI0035BA1698